MTSKPVKNKGGQTSMESFAFIRQMLGELRQVAERERADLLCYLLEMAYVEAGDLQAGHRPLASIQHGERH
ncbi:MULTISPECIES: hypothetical protein [Rhizobium]|uniref:Uncharacterized protein n=2 Tax=Rhizobium TaxID=379 RepID=A0AAF1KRA5_9HYPH|nr:MULTISPECIES: hypothetical protein [Rhizobium]MBZ5759986.1 hypothetical protein [Rhizobium sp. VS19-DR96]MBZ5766533.1 hypothetical protein [Rhizobium sp. VS19-DR129.2]MBZ5774124.1 hypothetical protein [Rhizobium sp. VS19-DRK62.2]MBZ5785196.1 hypothetical protein [Rhizobium sp. VS19-DR121]MBZ5802795.1 hypothetical protein [Rhizobium sp. VS19-DR181]